MGWSQVGQLPFYTVRNSLFGEYQDALLLMGGFQGTGSPNQDEGSVPASGGVWRSVDGGSNWNRISNNITPLGTAIQNQGNGSIVNSRAFIGGGTNAIQRGKITNKWDTTSISSLKTVEIRWGSGGSAKGGTFAEAERFFWRPQIIGNKSFTSGFCIAGHPHNTGKMTLWYKKDIMKGGSWEHFSGDDAGVTLPETSHQGKIIGWQIRNSGVMEFYIKQEIGSSSVPDKIWKSVDGFNWALILDNPPWGSLSKPGSKYGACYFHGISGQLWLIGGNPNPREVWVSNDGVNWSLSEPFPIDMYSGAACIAGAGGADRLFVAGGRALNASGNVEKYDKVWVLT